MRGVVQFLGEMQFSATTEGGQGWIMDSPPDPTIPRGPSPVETVLLAAATCSAMDLVYILRRMRTPPESLFVDVEGERAAEEPRVITRMRLHYRVGGKGVTEAKVKRAINLSLEEYCSVIIMMKRGGVAVSSSWEILQGG